MTHELIRCSTDELAYIASNIDMWHQPNQFPKCSNNRSAGILFVDIVLFTLFFLLYL